MTRHSIKSSPTTETTPPSVLSHICGIDCSSSYGVGTAVSVCAVSGIRSGILYCRTELEESQSILGRCHFCETRFRRGTTDFHKSSTCQGEVDVSLEFNLPRMYGFIHLLLDHCQLCRRIIVLSFTIFLESNLPSREILILVA